jgi:hypothetical protein
LTFVLCSISMMEMERIGYNTRMVARVFTYRPTFLAFAEKLFGS